VHTTRRWVSKSNAKLGPRIPPAAVTVSRSGKPANTAGTTLGHPIRHLHFPHQNTLDRRPQSFFESMSCSIFLSRLKRNLLSRKMLIPHPKHPPFLVMPRFKNLTSRMDQETGGNVIDLHATLQLGRKAGPTGRRQLDRGRDQVVLPAGVTLGRAARSGCPERHTRGCHCGRQDRRVTSVGFRSVPVGGSGGGVFADGGWQWRSGAESGAGAGVELSPMATAR
jgi:hypothetical protein